MEQAIPGPVVFFWGPSFPLFLGPSFSLFLVALVPAFLPVEQYGTGPERIADAVGDMPGFGLVGVGAGMDAI